MDLITTPNEWTQPLAESPWVVTHPGFPQIRTCALERIRLVRAWVRYERYTEWTTRAGGSG